MKAEAANDMGSGQADESKDPDGSTCGSCHNGHRYDNERPGALEIYPKSGCGFVTQTQQIDASELWENEGGADYEADARDDDLLVSG